MFSCDKTPVYRPPFPDILGKLAPERLNHCVSMKQEMIGWQWHQLDHICLCKSFAPCFRQITSPAPHHLILQAGCSSWCPTNSVKTLKASTSDKYVKSFCVVKMFLCCPVWSKSWHTNCLIGTELRSLHFRMHATLLDAMATSACLVNTVLSHLR